MRRAAGFSLLELMVTLTVIAIVVGLATPSFRNFTRSTRVTSLNNDFVTALNLARSESVRRSVPVTVCPSADGATCGQATDWVSGWIVFQDPTASAVIATSDDIVQKWSQSDQSVQVSTKSTYVRYKPTGMIDADADINVDISYTGCRDVSLRHVHIAVIGSITTQLQKCT